MLGPRELLVHDSWRGELSRSAGPARARASPRSRRRRAGSTSRCDRGGAEAQVEGAAAGDPQPACAMDRCRPVRGVRVRVRRRGDTTVRRWRRPRLVGLEPENGSLRIELLGSDQATWLSKRATGVPRGTRTGRGEPMTSAGVIVDAGAMLALGGLGVLCAWTMRRYSTLSARNLYAPAAVGIAGARCCRRGARVAGGDVRRRRSPRSRSRLLFTAGACASPTSAQARSCGPTSRRDAGYGKPAPERLPGERVYLRSQGELVRRRPWPPAVPYVPMSTVDHDGLRLPLGEGQHIFACGATGSGKTTTMRRVLAARTLTQKAALLILDQKGDQEDVDQMSRLAAAAGVPFVLIDPQDPDSDRYQPLWGTPAQVAAQGGRADQAVGAVLLRRAAAAPRCRLPRAARRGSLAAVDSVPDRRVPPAATSRRSRESPKRLGEAHRQLRGASQGSRQVRGVIEGKRGSLGRRGSAAGRARAGKPRDRDTEDHARTERPSASVWSTRSRRARSSCGGCTRT